ncbi:MAG: glycosyltransferase [Candidatus Krumholzibacteria bacterium]|nr:glycosyltransferase [Candidatus Krumholzibacteria bacterium]
MRIAFTGDGSLGHIRRWVGYFHDRKHEVLLLSFEDIEGCTFPAVRIPRHLPTKLAGYLASLPIVRKRIDEFRPDIVNSLYVTGYGLIGSLMNRRPFVVSALGSDMLVDYPSSRIHRAQIRRAIGAADLITTDADNLTEAVIAAGGAREDTIKIIFGIDKSVFFPSESRIPSRTGGLNIISTRNLYDIYNIDLLVDAAKTVLSATAARFTICGDGPEKEKLSRKVSDLGILDYFDFAGRLAPEDIAERLRDSDIYVSTSRSDSTSVSLLEAMACGNIPVVTDIPANREWIKPGTNGFLVPVDSPEELARTLLEAADDREKTLEIRNTNFDIIREKGSWDENMRRLEGAFEDLLRTR